MDKEEQQTRLEQRLANITKNIRTGSPTPSSRGRIDELESRNFTLEEEVKDLRIQLNGKQNEINKIQELLNKRTVELEKTKNEYDEKMKKMRGIFNGANKTLMELRQANASKDSEIEQLKATMEGMEKKHEETTNMVDENQKSMEKITTELHSQSAMYNAQIEQLESKLRQSNQQVNQVKAEFQQYKIRAHALLEQRNSNNEGDVSSVDTLELVASNKKLESDLSFKTSELKHAQDKLRTTERDRKRACELNAQLEKEFEKAQRAAKENSETVKSIQKQLDSFQEENEHLKAETEARYLANVKDFDHRLTKAIDAKEKSLIQKQEENEALQKISEQLGEDLSQLRSELSRRNEHIDELQKQLANKIPSASVVRNAIRNDNSRSSSPSSVTSRTSGNYTDMEERTSNVSEKDKDKDNLLKLQHMAEMLNDSEAHVQRLLEQEKILKEELRKLDRLEKRQDLSVEYLKNVVLKFFESNPADREPLVPVISTILQLSPDEVQSLKENAVDANSNPVVLSFGVL
ncbi:15152_t:CDS:10 [Funneliformis mosseae]|uniref:15152_t:CDS:1 n=1 Tax=Funneliformis mosseae TaxID=27381 RepID=A0A9N8Z3B3_FUNMO|nr:15152_t:CDS:10 [Funneliformis mosseae]